MAVGISGIFGVKKIINKNIRIQIMMKIIIINIKNFIGGGLSPPNNYIIF